MPSITQENVVNWWSNDNDNTQIASTCSKGPTQNTFVKPEVDGSIAWCGFADVCFPFIIAHIATLTRQRNNHARVKYHPRAWLSEVLEVWPNDNVPTAPTTRLRSTSSGSTRIEKQEKPSTAALTGMQPFGRNIKACVG
jgi:hypothetical protein